MEEMRILNTDFWRDPVVAKEMSAAEKYFYLYLLTNHHTTNIGIYRITIEQMAADLRDSNKNIHRLMERFIQHYKLIRYNSETCEIAIKNWFNLILIEE
jgi:hypothetical protein